MAAGEVPKLVWGDAYGNTLTAAYPLDNATAWSDPREGSDFEQVSSGEEDAWVTGWDYFLEGDWRWVGPAEQEEGGTGWDGAAGLEAALQWLRQKNKGRFYPNQDVASYHEVYLVEPLRGKPDLEQDGTRRIRIRLREANDNPFTGF